MKRRLSIIFLLLACALGAVAQQPDRIQQHVKYLASDVLEGRRTGTKGATEAARYIAKEFSKLGLKPVASSAGGNGSESRYLQSFPYVAGVELGRNLLMFRMNDAYASLRVGEDYMPLGFSANDTVENASAILVGYGIAAPELNYNDYAAPQVTGRVAVALSGTPDGDNPHGQFARYNDVRWKATAARNAGAKALLVVASEHDFKQDKLSKLRHDHAGDAGIPVIAISRETAKILFFNKDVLAIEQAAKSKAEEAYKTLAWSITLDTHVVRNRLPAYNVIGMLEGSDPVLKNETIIIGAHYDHLGRGGEGSGSLAPRSGDIHYGADDNASGTAGVLELARLFSTQTPKPKRTIVFMAFGGEEEGLLGSNYYVNHPLLPLANTVAMINMDMIGRMKDSKLVVGGVGTAKEWRDIMAAEKSFQLTLNEDGFGPSDHSSFYAKQIPVLFFWTGTHADYHKPSDTFEKINYDDEARILALVARIVKQLDTADKRLTYTTAKSDATPRTGGFRVYLGTIPSYADSDNGLLLDGVRDDSPATKAGLKAGDRIVKIGTRDIKNVYDYTAALGEMKAGEEYPIEVVRGTERLSLKIKPETRK
ncbi:MAG: M20/M25/M40 family metallo-hydrolase [Acidobacteria bacterium]|nr:M20/M25/M40 family metallo-hydrolase [Acidobacteriota bacterium]MCA1627758.1 M20/M25/M40 family metallo-hydrolase [Acidobacteriota bacterium]